MKRRITTARVISKSNHPKVLIIAPHSDEEFHHMDVIKIIFDVSNFIYQ